MENFKDVKIVNLDDKSSRRIEDSELFEMKLILSCEPPIEWVEYFDNAWKSHRYSVKRKKVYVSGNILTVKCVPNEIEHHLPELQKIIEETNNWYKDYVYRRTIEKTKRKENRKKDEELLKDLKKKLFKER